MLFCGELWTIVWNWCCSVKMYVWLFWRSFVIVVVVVARNKYFTRCFWWCCSLCCVLFMLPLKSDGPCLLLLLSLIVADDYLFCCSIHFSLSSFCVVSINMLQHIISYQTIQSKQNNTNREKNKITVAYGNIFCCCCGSSRCWLFGWQDTIVVRSNKKPILNWIINVNSSFFKWSNRSCRLFGSYTPV